MDEEKARVVRQWLIKARHDLASAHCLNMADPPLLDTAAYHCQQAAEKALKAYLTLHDVPFHKTHLLVPLLAECEMLEPAFGALADAAEALTPFATAFRYPGDVLDPAQADVAEALQLSEKVVVMVLNLLPDDVEGNEAKT
ncbi:MAG: HEPN domain-containing protein [Thiohalocapsa sp.]